MFQSRQLKKSHLLLQKNQMSKSIYIGDVHFNCGGFERYVDAALFSILNIVKNEKPDEVIFLGDFLDTPTLNPDVAKKMAEWFYQFQQCAEKVFLITGNHDKLPRYKTPATAFLEEQGVITCFNMYSDEKKILLSHSHSGQAVNDVDGKLIAAHLGMRGVQVSAGYEYSNDDVLAYIGKPRAIILGHIHTPSDAIRDGVPVYIPGNICPCNWSDSSDQRHVIKVTDSEIEMIPFYHVRTKTVYHAEDVKGEPNTIYRLVASEEEIEKVEDKEQLQSVVIQKKVKPVIKGMTKDTLIALFCKRAGVDETRVRKLLLEAGVHA